MCNLDNFKQRTKGLCAANGITIKFIHQKINKGTTYLNDVWRGKTTIADSDLLLVAAILHTTPEYLKGETDDPSPADSGSEEWMDEIKISPHKLAAAKTIAAMSDEGAEIINGMSKLSVEDLLKVEKIIDMIKGE